MSKRIRAKGERSPWFYVGIGVLLPALWGAYYAWELRAESHHALALKASLDDTAELARICPGLELGGRASCIRGYLMNELSPGTFTVGGIAMHMAAVMPALMREKSQ